MEIFFLRRDMNLPPGKAGGLALAPLVALVDDLNQLLPALLGLEDGAAVAAPLDLEVDALRG